MMASVFSKTLYQKRFFVLGWLLGIVFMVFTTMAAYKTFNDGGVADSLRNLPPALQKLVGDLSTLKTVQGYIAQQIFAMRAPLLLIIMSIAIMIGLSAGEEDRGLVETQLALPVGRTGILLQKLAAALVCIVIASVGVVIGIVLGLLAGGQHYAILKTIPPLAGSLLVAIDYGLVGFTVAAATGRRSLALAISSGWVFLGFLINSLALSVHSFAAYDKVTFFHYYQYKGGFNWADLSLLAGIAMLLIAIALVGFNRRDIRVH